MLFESKLKSGCKLETMPFYQEVFSPVMRHGLAVVNETRYSAQKQSESALHCGAIVWNHQQFHTTSAPGKPPQHTCPSLESYRLLSLSSVQCEFLDLTGSILLKSLQPIGSDLAEIRLSALRLDAAMLQTLTPLLLF